ncbi:MAG TPA: ABC transporter ATP-binding protein [Paludibacteraceae bacterium]|jgi:ABC-2 type transport system ATP-binding protein|nr:ABC transporter ATP-binding protein [Paludibacteraceae bacterium]OPZ02340.1 MAG: ABC transporter ATP-binding protein YtrB [Bacteroidetes bacterium ADurb.BinA395]MBP8965967.1 ABC transporter ATP-binding protein [Paludibacteraceae bacterium]HOF97932.1 ABC transporter ATP-binding protein [Paludibacteraceae bacterium]HON02539.1 ABC transporter ATP-binding protein [Paludibacteraceae bacterium]
MIQIKHVEFSYSRNAQLFTGLELSLSPGHIHGILGKNGEGKSTLLKMISGMIFPQKGEIEVLGYEPRKRQPEMLREIFFLPEELPPITLSIENYEKVYAPFYPHFNHEQFQGYLQEFEINSGKSQINKLSYGQKKKVFMAFGLATNTKIVLLDEPTNGLDIPSKAQFRKMTASALEEERIMLISTHQVRDLDSLIDSIIIMNSHQIVFNELCENITEKLLFSYGKEKSEGEEVLYSEENLRGFDQVSINKTGEESKLDIELLFNTVLKNHQRIREIFSNQNNKRF